MEQERFEDFVGIIGAISKEIQRIKAHEASKLGLKGADVMLLYQLMREPAGLTSAELARRSGVTRAAISRYVAGLEERGFVRIEEDELSEALWLPRGEIPPRGNDVSLTAEMMERFRLGQDGLPV